MKTRALLVSFIFILSLLLYGQNNMTIKITTVFDNTTLDQNCTPEWGYACVIETPEETVLFDTGNDGQILESNLQTLGFKETTFSKIIISHMHWDHYGGLKRMMTLQTDAEVFLPASATETEMEKANCSDAIMVKEARPINSYIYSLGEMKGPANEQSLAIPTAEGLVVITGCAHPGIVEIVREAKKQFPQKKIHLVLGGFHLNRHSDNDVLKIARELKALGVEKAGATHCTGQSAIHVFEQEFGKNYVKAGVGLRLEFKL
jgi:7,8-dihydropterin-6-yl-methyl-4-(beta-D-ribofuranosyl)aminobenzene 5'-phosphate synthase